jgi:hypothetical protein
MGFERRVSSNGGNINERDEGHVKTKRPVTRVVREREIPVPSLYVKPLKFAGYWGWRRKLGRGGEGRGSVSFVVSVGSGKAELREPAENV